MKRLLFVISQLLLVSCAPRQNKPADLPEPTVPSPDQQMADFLGDSQPGASASFAGTSYGENVTVTIRDDYISALGELCREGLVTNSGGTTRIAACRDKKAKQWRLAPYIFPKGAL